MSLFGKDTYNYITNEIDYEKLAKAIVSAKEIERNEAREKLEKTNKDMVANRLKRLKVEDCFDAEGNPKNIKSYIKVCYNFMKAKEDVLKDITLLSEMINGIVAVFFWLIEWCLYIVSFGFIGVGLVKYIDKYNYNETLNNVANFGLFFEYVVFGVIVFILSRIIVRLLKIECLHNKDFNYMLNLFAVIVAVIAIVVSVVVR